MTKDSVRHTSILKSLGILLLCTFAFANLNASNPVGKLLERLSPGASSRFIFEKKASTKDYFELESLHGKIVVRGNTYVNVATGLRWYLKHYLHANVSWNNMHVQVPDSLPAPPARERHETDLTLRYDLNYCTYSYSMAFWDWERWEKEIDWMALHGINMPLAITGTECVWFNVLKKSGYSREEIDEFISGPAFFAWWLMNNLEGWGGPLPDNWYHRREALQKKILARMRELDIKPVLAGYSGMVPHNAKEKLGLNVTDPGTWCGYRRPAFLQPTDPKFASFADLYYKEMTRLYGKADYYSMDPFHEGGNVAGVNLAKAGEAIMQAMKRCNPRAAWVVQAWGSNPRESMIKPLKKGDLIVLDLFAESLPKWGDPASATYRKEGFNGHEWLYCMLLNYGGNVGLHGKMQHVVDEFFKARTSAFGTTLKGVGMTMEGIENNPVMYELLCELPWHPKPFTKEEWLKGYVTSRYGQYTPALYEAWIRLSNSIYACPAASYQQGTHESVFCARPSDKVYQVSSWSSMSDYYDPWEVIRAAYAFASEADRFRGNNNYEYDLADIVRQAVAEKGRMVYKVMQAARQAGEKPLFEASARRFMQLLEAQDRLLDTRPEFRLDTHLAEAERYGNTPEEKQLYAWNLKVQITTWGNRTAADEGGLHDYAHKEWSGLLKGFYAMRWQAYIDRVLASWGKHDTPLPDYYPMEEQWAKTGYPIQPHPQGNTIDVAKQTLRLLMEDQED